jgi:hypothetical protein
VLRCSNAPGPVNGAIAPSRHSGSPRPSVCRCRRSASKPLETAPVHPLAPPDPPG